MLATSPSTSAASRLGCVLLALLGLVLAGTDIAGAAEDEKTLLDASKTILDQPIVYPTGSPAKISAAVITLKPGEERGWHKHEVPLVGYILDGELTIDFGPRGKKVFRKGEAFVEAVDNAHNGRNLGTDTVRILAVFIGTGGSQNTVHLSGPPPQ